MVRLTQVVQQRHQRAILTGYTAHKLFIFLFKGLASTGRILPYHITLSCLGRVCVAAQVISMRLWENKKKYRTYLTRRKPFASLACPVSRLLFRAMAGLSAARWQDIWFLSNESRLCPRSHIEVAVA